MRVLLRADVSGVGKKGDIVEVADGFGRNYLVPRGLALKATPGVEAQAESMRRSRDQKDAQDRSAAEDIAKVLVPLTITVPAKAGAEGKLFGSVTTAEIAQAVADQARVDLDRKTIEVPEAIKTTGEHMVSVKLHADVQFQFKLDARRQERHALQQPFDIGVENLDPFHAQPPGDLGIGRGEFGAHVAQIQQLGLVMFQEPRIHPPRASFPPRPRRWSDPPGCAGKVPAAAARPTCRPGYRAIRSSPRRFRRGAATHPPTLR